MQQEKIFKKIKNIFMGKALNPFDAKLFHKLSLTAFLAWIGLGADGISSSCYGPQEAFLVLGEHTYLAIFVALATVFTIFIISKSYSQIVELFPNGGGGYLVASRLLSPSLGMISGCALIIDYVLTITISIASGTDALFSFLPPGYQEYKILIAIGGILFLTFLNIRGVKESVVPLIPIFLVFIATHVFAILYAFIANAGTIPSICQNVSNNMHADYANSNIGIAALLILVVRSYIMGAGTYTGIEAVSNGMTALREPRIETAKKTMSYMTFSLSFLVFGLMAAYIFYNVGFENGKTLNAVFFEKMTNSWGITSAQVFIFCALLSEALLLFAAAQTGFLGGPRVISNMASDQWFPIKFSMLNDRLVTQNGIVLMSIAALAILVYTKGSVSTLIILYSINVFITFALSQLGMIKHWWEVKDKQNNWKKKILVSSIGFVLTIGILCCMILMKFNQGAWITLVITGLLALLAFLVKRHYVKTKKLLKRLNDLVKVAGLYNKKDVPVEIIPNYEGRTAVFFVSGYNGLGLHTLFNVLRYFGNTFENFVFVQIGLLDAGNMKSKEEVDKINKNVEHELQKYINLMRDKGYYAEGFPVVGVSVIDAAEKIAPEITEKFPHTIFFGGQISFKKNLFIHSYLHNYTVFNIQKKFYDQGIPFFVVPIRV